MWLDFLKVVTILGSMWALSRFGPVWACVGVGVGFGLNAVQMVRAMKPDGYSPMRIFLAMVPPLAACVPMVVAVLAVRRLHLGGHVTALLVELGAGAVAYTIGALVIARSASAELLGLLRRGLTRD
jgi:PST family polysaccharide transporter